MTAPSFVAYCGLPGVGKSTAAQYTAKEYDTSRLRTDEIRKELFDDPTYSSAEDDATYEELFRRAREALAAGDDVVLDATFGCRRHRDRASEAADAVGVDLTFVRIVCDQAVTEQRIAERTAGPSDADVDIYRTLRERYDPFERAHIEIDNSETIETLHEKIDRQVHDHLVSNQ